MKFLRHLRTATMFISCLVGQSTAAAPRVGADGYLNMPYDGNVTPADLLSKGTNATAAFYGLLALTDPPVKDEFETTAEYLLRSSPEKRARSAWELFGNRLLVRNHGYISNSFTMNYSADRQVMVLKSSYLYTTLDSKILHCDVSGEVIMDVDSARRLKADRNIEIAYLIELNFSSRDSYISNNIHIEYFPGIELMSFGGREGDVKLPNFRPKSVEAIFFKGQNGEIISRMPCKNNSALSGF